MEGHAIATAHSLEQCNTLCTEVKCYVVNTAQETRSESNIAISMSRMHTSSLYKSTIAGELMLYNSISRTDEARRARTAMYQILYTLELTFDLPPIEKKHL